MRKTAKFHAPRTPASSSDKKGRRGRAELPGPRARCVRPLVARGGREGPAIPEPSAPEGFSPALWGPQCPPLGPEASDHLV